MKGCGQVLAALIGGFLVLTGGSCVLVGGAGLFGPDKQVGLLIAVIGAVAAAIGFVILKSFADEREPHQYSGASREDELRLDDIAERHISELKRQDSIKRRDEPDGSPDE